MIVARAPFRVTIGSGVGDVLAIHAGASASVISATLDSYVYVTAHLRQDTRVVAGWSKREVVESAPALENSIVRACLARVGFEHGIEVHFVSELPIHASGMGGSASAATALLVALWGLRGFVIAPGIAAEAAAAVEIDDLKRTVGKQDHYAAAFGGLQRLTFQPNGRVTSNAMPASLLDFLDGLAWLSPCRGDGRDAHSLLTDQVKAPTCHHVAARLDRLADMADQSVRGQNVQSVIAVLNEAWECKKSLSASVSSPEIDAAIEGVKAFGGGAKLCGAGGSGYILAVIPRSNVEPFLKCYPDAIQAHFGGRGAHVIHDDGKRAPFIDGLKP